MLQLTITYILYWQIILMDPHLNNSANVTFLEKRNFFFFLIVMFSFFSQA